MKHDTATTVRVIIYPWETPLMQETVMPAPLGENGTEMYRIALPSIIITGLKQDPSPSNILLFFISEEAYHGAQEVSLEDFYLAHKQAIVDALCEKIEDKIALVLCPFEVADDLRQCFEPGIDYFQAKVFDPLKTSLEWKPVRLQVREDGPYLIPVPKNETFHFS